MARLTATLALSVELDASELRVIGEDVLSDVTRDAYVGRERTALLQTLPAERTPGYMGYAMPDISAYSESRSGDEFKLEVEAYASAVASHWMTVVAVTRSKTKSRSSYRSSSTTRTRTTRTWSPSSLCRLAVGASTPDGTRRTHA
jgi:hypothetical protein